MRSFPTLALLITLGFPLGASEDFPLSIAARTEKEVGGYALMVTNENVNGVRVLVTASNKKLEDVVDAKSTWDMDHMDDLTFGRSPRP